MKSIPLIILLSVISFCSCNNRKEGTVSGKPGKEEMAELNSYFVEKDRERIKNYSDRKGLEMKESSSGLWYRITDEGEGRYFTDHDLVIMDYECSLLDGTKCYSSADNGPREIVLGKTPIEAGMYEGLKMLKPGGKAVFILPPFLAYGLIGDNKAIPARATIVYEVRIRKSN